MQRSNLTKELRTIASDIRAFAPQTEWFTKVAKRLEAMGDNIAVQGVVDDVMQVTPTRLTDTNAKPGDCPACNGEGALFLTSLGKKKRVRCNRCRGTGKWRAV